MTARTEKGTTLVELLVALALSSVVAIAAMSTLIASRRGFTAVDAAAQLRDNARFSADLIQRLGVQTGYKDFGYSTTSREIHDPSAALDPDPDLSGFNNALVRASDPLNSATTRTVGSVGYGSDILILRYQTGETYPGSGVSDQSMIDCAGNSVDKVAIDRDDRIASIFHVAVGLDGEPSLMCTVPGSKAQPVVQGVENFQVLYGVDGVVPDTAPKAGAVADSVADRFLRADQLVVKGNPSGTHANWRRVRSLRIGMVLRGPLGSAHEKQPQTFYPFGLAKASAADTAGSAMSSSDDAGTVFNASADGRLRQALTFTIHLRNEQML